MRSVTAGCILCLSALLPRESPKTVTYPYFIPLCNVTHSNQKLLINLASDIANGVTDGRERMWKFEWSNRGLTIRLKQAADYERFADTLETEHKEALRQYGVF
jgi:hypothetical protein